jgi:hypothetical protein
MDVKTIRLNILSPNITNLRKQIIDKYFDYINIEDCIKHGIITDRLPELYINLLDEFDLQLSEHKIYHILKIKNRNLYKQLSSNTKIIIPEVIIGITNNENSKVLKLNINNSNVYKLLNEYHIQLKNELNTTKDSNDSEFYGYITLVSLKSNTPDEIVQKIKIEFINKIDSYMEIQSFWLISDNKLNKMIKIS